MNETDSTGCEHCLWPRTRERDMLSARDCSNRAGERHRRVAVRFWPSCSGFFRQVPRVAAAGAISHAGSRALMPVNRFPGRTRSGKGG